MSLVEVNKRKCLIATVIRRTDYNLLVPTAQLTSKEVEAEPFCVWNSFVNLLAKHSYEELSAEQRPAHLVFWYESEVQNGGHLQYFENRGVEHLAKTIAALGLIGAS